MKPELLVKYLAQSLVQQPDAVKVTTVDKGRTIVLELSVAPDDMGRVIGRQGRIANAIRAVVKSATSNSRKKYVVDIL
ncbi:MAG: KH domain-containing protein [Eubacteriales bacterium]|nr:KH domain-containing protein [Eubacteriales bacterium]